MSYAEYEQMSGIRWTHLKTMDVSPLAYLHASESGDSGDTPSRGFLRAVHVGVLEAETFRDRYFGYDAVRNGKKWEAAKILNEGKESLKSHEVETIRKIRAAVLRHPEASALIAHTEGQSEVAIEWTDSRTGLRCKGLIDKLIRPNAFKATVVDLKTVDSIEPSHIAKLCTRLKWHGQLAHYCDGVAATLGIVSAAYLVCVEQRAPHDVGVFLLHPDRALRAGRELRDRLLSKLRQCIVDDHFPGRLPMLEELDLPDWAFDEPAITPSDEGASQ